MPEISAAQQAASRANGALSHGPVSEAGKRRSSLNAARHGLAGRIVVLPKEDMERYQAFSQKLLADLKPVGALEQQYAQTIVEQNWRLACSPSKTSCSTPGKTPISPAPTPK